MKTRRVRHGLAACRRRNKGVTMRRGFALLRSLSALGLVTPAALAQYPYPYQYGYGPMPVQYTPPMPQYSQMPPPYVQPYGYPPYGYWAPPPPRPMYPAPMPAQTVARRNTNVFVYGPLDDAVVIPPNPVAETPKALPPMPKSSTATDVKQTQGPPAQPAGLTRTYRTMPTFSKADLLPEYEGATCDGSSCGSGYCASSPPSHERPMHGRGHFIFDVGVSVLAPRFDTRNALTITQPDGTTATTNFAQQVLVGPRFELGYVSHCGWGVRADYWHLNGWVRGQLSNGDAGP